MTVDTLIKHLDLVVDVHMVSKQFVHLYSTNYEFREDTECGLQ